MDRHKWRIKKQAGLWYLYEPYVWAAVCRGTFHSCVVTFAGIQKSRCQESKRWKDG